MTSCELFIDSLPFGLGSRTNILYWRSAMRLPFQRTVRLVTSMYHAAGESVFIAAGRASSRLRSDSSGAHASPDGNARRGYPAAIPSRSARAPRRGRTSLSRRASRARALAPRFTVEPVPRKVPTRRLRVIRASSNSCLEPTGPATRIEAALLPLCRRRLVRRCANAPRRGVMRLRAQSAKNNTIMVGALGLFASPYFRCSVASAARRNLSCASCPPGRAAAPSLAPLLARPRQRGGALVYCAREDPPNVRRLSGGHNTLTPDALGAIAVKKVATGASSAFAVLKRSSAASDCDRRRAVTARGSLLAEEHLAAFVLVLRRGTTEHLQREATAP